MKNKFRDTFDRIHAEEELKESTRAYLAERMQGEKRRRWKYSRVMPVVACIILLCMVWGGYEVYMKPVSMISIDVNPSMELGINRFDRVVAVKGFNKEGEILASELDIKFIKYTEALQEILSSRKVRECMRRNEAVYIDVVGENEEKSSRMLSDVESCTQGHGNTHCGSSSREEAKEAKDLGLSCGKYRAYLEVHELDPEITPEEISQMTMREIRDLIARLSGEEPEGPSGYGNGGENHGRGNGHHGNGHHGNGGGGE